MTELACYNESPRAFQNNQKKIPIKCKQRNKSISIFLWSALTLAILSFCYLDVDWSKTVSRMPDIATVFWNLGHFNFNETQLILEALLDTICIAVLSLLYSLVIGVIFGMLAARNVFKINALSIFTQAFFSFLRAVPTPIWVLLMLVCFGMGPEAGVAGLCIHTTAFFTKSFAQSFESIPDETLEALETTGTSKINVFFNAVLPAAFSQIVAWCGMRLEINFSECAILGMVGAGGVGFVIANSLHGYDYGTAGFAILLVFITAYSIERLFVNIKKKFS